MNADGTLAAGRGATTARNTGAGTYEVTLGFDVTNCGADGTGPADPEDRPFSLLVSC